MKILLSNDDGVDASGILALKQAVEEFGEVYVVAPSNQQSGIGHALTLYEPLRINKTILRDGSLAYSVSGTPTDAVTLGVYEIMDEKQIRSFLEKGTLDESFITLQQAEQAFEDSFKVAAWQSRPIHVKGRM